MLPIMKLTLAPLRRLQWKLTLSYTLVTVSALVVVEIILLVAALLLLTSDIFANLMIVGLRDQVVPQIRPYLAQTPPDLDGLHTWLDTLQNTNTQVNADGSVSSNSVLDFGSLKIDATDQRLLVFDANQHLLGEVPAASETAVSAPFNFATIPGSSSVLAAALRGETDNNQLYTKNSDNITLIAVPIRSAENQVLGALLMLVEMPPLQTQTLGPLLQAILFTILPLTIGAGFIGTIFGFLTARGLTRRLHTMSQAADAWSHGDFTVTARDTSGDELGQLSRRLNRMAEQLQNLLDTRQELATLEERNRLARDLHDSVKQQVFATAMQIGAAQALLDQDIDAAKACLSEAEKLARQSQQELTGLIQELRPVALEGKGLVEALRDFAADWSRRTGIVADVRVQGAQALPLPVAQIFFRVAQEALANVARHSYAETAVLHLLLAPDNITLTIQDNGQGFDPDRSSIGVGLKSMQERMEELNGNLHVHSQPGQGTQVIARVSDISHIAHHSTQPTPPNPKKQESL